MMKKIIILLLFSFGFNNLTVLAQEKTERVNFIITIDNEFPDADIIDGEILIKNSNGEIKNKITFNYNVGALWVSPPDYNKLFNVNKGDDVFIRFKQKNLSLDTEYFYEKEIPPEWINSDY